VFFPATSRGWTLTLAATPLILVGACGLAFLHRALIELAATRGKTGRSARPRGKPYPRGRIAARTRRERRPRRDRKTGHPPMVFVVAGVILPGKSLRP